MTGARRAERDAQRRERLRLPLTILVAIGLHLVGLAYIGPHSALFARLGKGTASKPVRVVNATPALQNSLRQNRAAMKAAKQETKPPTTVAQKPKTEPKPDGQLHGQIVDIPPSADNRAPDQASYLSEYNTRTERETRSRHQEHNARNVMNEPTVTQATQPNALTGKQLAAAKAIEIGPERPASAKPKTDGGAQEQALEMPRQRAHSRLALKLEPGLGTLRNQEQREAAEGNSDRLRLSVGQEQPNPETPGSAPTQGPPNVNLIPQLGVLAKVQGAPSNDYLKDVEEGEGTFLNSRQFKFASFFNRMRRGVDAEWRPLDEYRRRDPSGNIYGYRSRYTELNVHLNADGTLRNVEVARSCGVDFLDSAAVNAFQRAQPFPNPPKGLINASGEIAFQFGFHIEFNGWMHP